MLDFRQASRPRYSWNRRQYLTALFAVVVLGLVLGLSRDWRQLDWLLKASSARDPQGETVASREPAIDTRVPPQADRELPGTFLSPGVQEAESETEASGKYFPGVKPSSLSRVRDDSPLGPAEHDAWFNFLDVLDKTDLQVLKKASKGRVTFAQLFRQSDEYRGELVNVRGVVRRVHRVTAPKNDYGIKTYYQIWITPEDNPSNVEAVFCLRLPPKFPLGDGLAEQVEFTGFHFKRWLYRAQDTLRSAPVILAQTVQWQKRPAMARSSSESWGTLIGFVILAAVCAAAVVAVMCLRTRRRRRPMPDVRIEIPQQNGPSE